MVVHGGFLRDTKGALPALGFALLLATTGFLVTPAPSRAEEPILHHVQYTVTAENPFRADIYYRDTDPPTFADYSHNPYQFSPKVEADVGPDRPWVLEVMLVDPDQWAMVTATSGLSPDTSMVHCELAVDGVVVDSNDGPEGALSSLRHW
jgi:hypothetical protein